jgi:hypothetical protein
MVALRNRASEGIDVDFDEDADVLYITFGPVKPGYGDRGEEDVVLRFADDDSPTGVTVIGYYATGWPLKKERLAEITARHLRLPTLYVLKALSVI